LCRLACALASDAIALILAGILFNGAALMEDQKKEMIQPWHKTVIIDTD